MTKSNAKKAGPKRASMPKAKAGPRFSRLQPPTDIPVEAWQIALRKQYGREQSFLLDNLGTDPVFSEFRVANPQNKSVYRVGIRGAGLGDNYCSCPDFATNDLGTCKHVEYTLGVLEKQRGGKAALKRGYAPPYSEIYLRYGGQRRVHFRPGAGCPPELSALARDVFLCDAGWYLPPERFSRIDDFMAAAAGHGHEVRAYEDALGFMAESRDRERRERTLAQRFPEGAASPALANLLRVPLYPYQAEGALFAARAGRCLIGDEMGLGKTIQAIAAAEILARDYGVERMLVICPTSLKHQWQREIARFSGREANVVSGLRLKRQQQYAQQGFCKITSYDTLKTDLDLVQSWSPDLVIVDEAQRIKNWNTIAARMLKRIDSPYAIVLTGTPLENRLEELISIVQFVDRHRLGPTWRMLHEHQVRDDHGRVIGYQALDRINETLAPILIRRRKKEVLDQLPERLDKNFFVPMTEPQLKHHTENADIVARIVAKWRRTRYLSEADQRRLTCSLQNMRMACNSTYLLDRVTDHGVKADELATLLAEVFEEPESKVVVFSQWVLTHELIARRLDANGWGYVHFHGGVPGEKRQDLVDRFREDPACRVFLSTDAGGVGLNLQHASVVVNMDLPWNPAVLEQRIARVHRLGQRRPVRVVNFIAQGTIEEGMLATLAFKKSLFAGILDGGQAEVFLNGTRLSRFMEGVEKVTGVMGTAEPVVVQEETTTPVRSAETQPSGAVVPETAPGASGDSEEQPDEPPPERGQPAQPRAADPWAQLLEVGIQAIQSLAQQGGARPGEANGSSWVEADERTGQRYLKLPMPAPETIQRVADSLATLLAGLRR